MITTCGPNCGWCGRCEREPVYVVDLSEHRYPDPCDWCEKLVDPEDQLHANYGGRFCSDECASLYAEAFEASEMPAPRKAI